MQTAIQILCGSNKPAISDPGASRKRPTRRRGLCRLLKTNMTMEAIDRNGLSLWRRSGSTVLNAWRGVKTTVKRDRSVLRSFLCQKTATALLFGFFLASFGLMSRAGTPFDPQAFAAAQATGKPVLVEVVADWCSTCSAQTSILSDLLARPAYKSYQVFTVDFDKQKAALKFFAVRDRSTLIVYKGKQEKGRSIWATDRESITALLNKAM